MDLFFQLYRCCIYNQSQARPEWSYRGGTRVSVLLLTIGKEVCSACELIFYETETPLARSASANEVNVRAE